MSCGQKFTDKTQIQSPLKKSEPYKKQRERTNKKKLGKDGRFMDSVFLVFFHISINYKKIKQMNQNKSKLF